jgi:hypothetical protein
VRMMARVGRGAGFLLSSHNRRAPGEHAKHRIMVRDPLGKS